MGSRRATLGVLTALAGLLACGSPAAASTVSVRDFGDPVGLSLLYDADPGEANDVTVSGDLSGILIADPGAVITAGGGCESIDPTHVHCSALPYVAYIDLELGARDDRAQIEDSAYPPATSSIG